MLTPAYESHLQSVGYQSTRPTDTAWTPELSLEFMDGRGIDASILSLAKPGLHAGDGETASRAVRASNEFAAGIVDQWPTRFGVFGSLVLPDVQRSITEAMYCYEHLGVDGVLLFTNAHGIYLGDPRLDPLMHVLDKLHAVVFIHPTDLPGGTSVLGPGIPIDGVAPYVIDYLLDTTRAAINLVRHDVFERFPNLKLILANGGGFLSHAAARIAHLIPIAEPRWASDELLESMRKFYFDVTFLASRWSMPGLRDFAASDRLLYGTDFPAVPHEVIDVFRSNLLESDDLTIAQRQDIGHRNALELFPRLKRMLSVDDQGVT